LSLGPDAALHTATLLQTLKATGSHCQCHQPYVCFASAQAREAGSQDALAEAQHLLRDALDRVVDAFALPRLPSNLAVGALPDARRTVAEALELWAETRLASARTERRPHSTKVVAHGDRTWAQPWHTQLGHEEIAALALLQVGRGAVQ
jgi:hypothetical protein